MTLRGGKMENKKEHYKLYKSGKIWVTASIVAAVMGATTVSVSASTDNTVADKQSIESSPKSKTLDKSVSSADLDQSIKDAKKANVDVRENSKASNITSIQGTNSADSSLQLQSTQDSDTEDYKKQVGNLNNAQQDEQAYQKALDTNKKSNKDGKTQIATSGNKQALTLDTSRTKQDNSQPDAKTAQKTKLEPTKVYILADKKTWDVDNKTGQPIINDMQPTTGDSITPQSDTVWKYTGSQLIGSTITKSWTNAATLSIADGQDGLGNIKTKQINVDFHQSFHDFQLQNGNFNDETDYKKPGLPSVEISSNLIQNVRMNNLNWATTFWMTYSGTEEIVPISKMTGKNGEPKVYFLSGSLSSTNYDGPAKLNPAEPWDNWSINRKEYAQTYDAQTAVISAGSTIGLTNISSTGSKTNVKNGLAYANTSSEFQSPSGEDDDPEIYAIQEGVSFTDFTSDRPTLYFGSVAMRNDARWWHDIHILNSDKLAFVQKPTVAYHKNTISYTQIPIKSINERINYVDTSGNKLADSYETNDSNNKKFITLTRVREDGTDYVEHWTTTGEIGTDKVGNPTVVKKVTKDINGKDVISETITGTNGWKQLDSNSFPAIKNKKISGYKVVGTTDKQSTNENFNTTKQIVTATEPNQLREITVAYEPQIKKANVHYVLKNINGVELLPSTKLTGKSGQSFYDKNGNFISYNSKNESTIYNIPQTLDQAVGNIKDSNDQKLHYLGTSDASGGCFVKNSDGEQNIWVIYTYVTDGKDGQDGKNGEAG